MYFLSMNKLLLLPFILLIILSPRAQIQLKSPLEAYYETVSLFEISQRPVLNYRSLSNNKWPINDSLNHPWQQWEKSTTEPLWAKDSLALTLVAPTWYNSYNLNTPLGGNDRGLWQGRGYNSSLSAGVVFKSKHFEASFVPDLYFSENKYITIAPSAIGANGSEYGYYIGGLDAPQRFGNQAYADWSLGQTEIRFNYNAFTLGAGTQNVWLGPLRHQPIIWSNNAAGFPKIDIGMNKRETPIGAFETRFWWGFLQTSNYFTGPSSAPVEVGVYHDFIAGFTFSYAPKFIPGLTLGVQKTAQSPLDSFAIYAIFSGMDPGFGGQQKFGGGIYDNRLSVSWEWVAHSIGLSFYGEWAREDYTSNLLEAAEHSRGLGIGVRQVFDLTKDKKHLLMAEIEVTSLVYSRDYLLNSHDSAWGVGWGGGYYRNGGSITGYTNKGQIIGASMGSGSNAQHYGLTYYAPFGSAGLFLTRTGHDDTELYAPGQDSLDVRSRPVGLEIGASGTILLPHSIMVKASVSYVEERNWKFDMDEDIKGARFTLGASWHK